MTYAVVPTTVQMARFYRVYVKVDPKLIEKNDRRSIYDQAKRQVLDNIDMLHSWEDMEIEPEEDDIMTVAIDYSGIWYDDDDDQEGDAEN